MLNGLLLKVIVKFLHKRVLTVVLVTVDTGHSFPKKNPKIVRFGAGMGQQLFSTVRVVGVSLPSHSAQPFPKFSSRVEYLDPVIISAKS